MNLSLTMNQFFIQLVCILIVCRFVTIVGKNFLGQASVTCEMIAGVLLGPSFLGYFFPDIKTMLFPEIHQNGVYFNQAILYSFGQIGLILYMFAFGYQLGSHITNGITKKSASLILSAGVLSPFIFGCLLFILFPKISSNLISVNGSVYLIPLTFGLALSITALPMLARIIEENHLTQTSLGRFSIFYASIYDIFSWFFLALLLAIFHGKPIIAVNFIIGFFTILVISKFLNFILCKSFIDIKDHSLSVVIFCTLFSLAYVSETCGVYAVFSSLLLGIFLTQNKKTDAIINPLSLISQRLFLPLFFVYCGLNTNFVSVFNSDLGLFAIVVVLIAFISKGGVCFFMSYLAKQGLKNSLLFGTLINSRGLMELIFLNILLKNGVISTQFYSIMVLVAIITTMFTVPMFKFLKQKIEKPKY